MAVRKESGQGRAAGAGLGLLGEGLEGGRVSDGESADRADGPGGRLAQAILELGARGARFRRGRAVEN